MNEISSVIFAVIATRKIMTVKSLCGSGGNLLRDMYINGAYK